MYLDPIAFSLGPPTVYWYGIILGSAAFFGLLLAVVEAKRIGYNPDLLMDFMLFAVPAAILGARLYYVAFQWEYYLAHPQEILAVWNGGLAIHGALIGGVVTAILYTRRKNISFWQLADIAAPSLLLGQMIGRWGNFMNQEAHGGPVSREFLEGLYLPNWIIEQMNINGTYYHPTFLYESVWNLLGIGVLILLRSRNPRRGTLALTYAVWYSIGRFFIEGLRTDSLAFYGPAWLAQLMSMLWSPMGLLFEPGSMSYGTVRIAQFIGLILLLLAVALLIYRRRAGLSEKRYLNVE